MDVKHLKLAEDVLAEFGKSAFDSDNDYPILSLLLKWSLLKGRDFTPPLKHARVCELTGLDKAVVSRFFARMVKRERKRENNVLEERSSHDGQMCYGFCFPADGWNVRLRTCIRDTKDWLSAEADLFPEGDQQSLSAPVGRAPDASDGLRAASSSGLRLIGSAVTTAGAAPSGPGLDAPAAQGASARQVDPESTSASGASLLEAFDALKVDPQSTRKPKIVVPSEVDPQSTRSERAPPQEDAGQNTELIHNQLAPAKLSCTGVQKEELSLATKVDPQSTRAVSFKLGLREILEGDPDYSEPWIREAWDIFFEKEGTEQFCMVLVKKYEKNKKSIERIGAYLSNVAYKRGRWPREALKLIRKGS